MRRQPQQVCVHTLEEVISIWLLFYSVSELMTVLHVLCCCSGKVLLQVYLILSSQQTGANIC